jgi:hypothetical protein
MPGGISGLRRISHRNLSKTRWIGLGALGIDTRPGAVKATDVAPPERETTPKQKEAPSHRGANSICPRRPAPVKVVDKDQPTLGLNRWSGHQDFIKTFRNLPRPAKGAAYFRFTSQITPQETSQRRPIWKFRRTEIRSWLVWQGIRKNGMSEIGLLSKQMLGIPNANDINASWFNWSRAVTSRSASDPLTWPSNLSGRDASRRKTKASFSTHFSGYARY